MSSDDSQLISSSQAMALWNVSASVANMVGRGLRAHIGAHGEPPLGLMYHQEMFYAKAGGLNNYEVRPPISRPVRRV
jgi:hypothetical protein